MSFKNFLKDLFASKSRGDLAANGPLSQLPMAEVARSKALRVDNIWDIPMDEAIEEARIQSANAYASAITPN